MAMVRRRHFATSQLVNETLIPDTYQLYARVYERGDVEAYAIPSFILHHPSSIIHYPSSCICLLLTNICDVIRITMCSAKVALLANMTESEQTRSDMCQLGLKCGMHHDIVS